ncbi:MAG: UMP kinase [Alphaproteobacteria bacterium]|nr:UMP kinase [Alphaproteobacteria bacterium]
MFKRILLKLSGEGLMGNKPFGLDEEILKNTAIEIKKAYDKGFEICIVIGGGNIFRGLSGAAGGMDRVKGDHMGMLATVINSLAMQDSLNRIGVPAVVFSALSMPQICETFVQEKAIKAIQDKKVVIFSAGTGNPYFTTDTGAALRAVEMKCDAIFKATQVDGVYSSDPKKDKNAIRFDKVSFDEVLIKKLKVMDATAIALARENNLSIVVFSMHEKGALANVMDGKGIYTEITNSKE